MRIITSSLLCLCLLLAACQASAAANPLIGTWILSDQPVPAGCPTKIVFTNTTMYYESAAIPGLLPASKGTVNVLYGGDPKQPNGLAPIFETNS
jgi:hypothetical protein